MNYLFKHIHRCSINNDPHWNQDFFVNKFLEFDKLNRSNKPTSIQEEDNLDEKLIKKVWVCGTPIIQEIFDKSIEIANL